VRADFLNSMRRAEDCPPYQLDRPEVRTRDGFVLRRTGGSSIKLQKKRPQDFSRALAVSTGKQLCRYGLVVVVVVVSSCL
jgi:hypothetical protein